MNTVENIHDWFSQSLDAYVAGGLTPEERQKLEAHAAMCVACEAALAEAKNADAALRELFVACAPPPTFEDRLIEQLRTVPQRHRWIHPAVWRFAGGIAAVVLLGGFGFIGNRIMKSGTFPNFEMPRMAFLSPKPADHMKTGPKLGRTRSSEVEDQSALAEQKTKAEMRRGLRGEFDGQFERSLDAATENRVPYDDILRYPPNWPDISEVRDAEVGGDRSHRGDIALGFGSSPSDGPAQGRWYKTPDQLATETRKTVALSADGTLLLGGQTLNETAKDGKDSGLVVTNGVMLDSYYALGDVNGRALERTGKSTLTLNGGRTVLHGDSSYAGTTVISGGTLDYGTTKAGSGTVTLGNAAPADSTSRELDSITHEGIVKALPVTVAGTATGTVRYGYVDNTPAPKPGEVHYFTPPVLGKPTNVAVAMTEAEQKQLPALAIRVLTDGERNEDLSGKLAVRLKAPDDAIADHTTLGRPLEKDRTWAMRTQAADAQPADPGKTEPAKPVLPQPAGTQTAAQRKIIRNGQMEFEVDSFDSSFIQVGKIAAEESGYIASTDSEKLSNGKVKGTITLRVPPDHLDVLVLKLRGLGELKTQRITAQDVTKQYTDFESQLKAAHTMEDRLLEIIKSGKGEVKDLVEAEKQLDLNRQKIEQIEGELRYYNNMVSLSTLNITLFERDIKAPAAAFETEEVQASIEAEDVEKARTDALKAIEDFKGRVVESNLKKLEAGQLAATIVAEVAPESTGPLTDRLKQLGRVVRMEAERKQTTTGGVGAPTSPKLERKPTRFNISLYNLANIAPRETVNVTLAATDVGAAYKAILAAMRGEAGDAVNKLGDLTPIGRVVSSSLNSQKMDQASGSVTLEVKSDKIAEIEAAFRAAGTVMHYTVTENPDADKVTRAKRGYSIALVSVAQVPPRETQNLSVAAKNVPAQYQKLLTVLQDSKQPARILTSQLNEQDRQNITGSVDFEIPRAAAPLVESVLANGTDSDVYSRVVARSNDTENTLDTKVHLTVSLINADRLAPREVTTIGVDVTDVEKALADVAAVTEGSAGRVLDRRLYKLQNGQIGAHAVLDVPLTASTAALDRLRSLGTVRSVDASKNPQVPEGPLARARFDVTLGDGTPLVSPEDGVGSRLRQGLQASVKGLTVSLMLIVIGVCLVGPFLLVGWIGWKLFRRRTAKV